MCSSDKSPTLNSIAVPVTQQPRRSILRTTFTLLQLTGATSVPCWCGARSRQPRLDSRNRSDVGAAFHHAAFKWGETYGHSGAAPLIGGFSAPRHWVGGNACRL